MEIPIATCCAPAVDKARNDGCAPLFKAVEQGQVEVVVALIAGAGAVVDEADDDGLDTAVRGGLQRTRDRDRRTGADKEAKTLSGTPLETALSHGHTMVFELLN